MAHQVVMGLLDQLVQREEEIAQLKKELESVRTTPELVPQTVCIHQIVEDHDPVLGVVIQEHYEGGEVPEGATLRWNVWLRVGGRGSSPPSWNEDPDFDADFDSEEAAWVYAGALANKFGVEIDHY